MQKTLLALVPFLLLGSQSSALPAYSSPTAPCPTKNNCESATFTLDNIKFSSTYSYSTPAHLATKEGHVSFDLSNSATPGAKSKCSADSMREFDFFYGEITYECTDGNKGTFTYNRPDGTFLVVQGWSCKGGNYGKSKNVSGTGHGKAKLDCKTDVYMNKDWKIGEIYSTTTTTCQPGKLTIAATVTSAK